VHSFWCDLNERRAANGKKYLVIRHDVDIASSSARKMWEVELKLQNRSSYYFRLATVDTSLLKDLHASGFEASYHYEELSTLIKAKGITEPQQAIVELDSARAAFKRNLNKLRSITGLPMRTVAAHGDFVNWRLNVYNTTILRDLTFRKEVDIDAEAYDDGLMNSVVGRYSDVIREHPRLWQNRDPVYGFKIAEPVIYLLVHPEGWVRDATRHLIDDLKRMGQEAAYSAAIRRRSLDSKQINRSSIKQQSLGTNIDVRQRLYQYDKSSSD
jgi:hypothetical protein